MDLQSKNPELEQLLANARRVRKDQQRREKLSALIDQWEAAETAVSPVSKRPLPWRWVGIAASLLLLGVLGIYLLHQPTPEVPQLTAQNQSPAVVPAPQPDTSPQTIADSPQKLPQLQPTSSAPQPAVFQASSTDTPLPDDEASLLLAQNEQPEHNEPDSHLPYPADVEDANTVQVFERRSTKLVKGQQPSKVETQIQNDRSIELPTNFALFNSPGTSTLISLAKIDL